MHGSREPIRPPVWIEIDVAAASIAGALHRGSAPVRPFDGWLELVALLDDLGQSGTRDDEESSTAGSAP